MSLKVDQLPEDHLVKIAQEIMQHLIAKGNSQMAALIAQYNPEPPKANQTSTYPFKFHNGQYVKHVKSGGIYSVVGLPNVYRLEATGEPAYAYMAQGTIWTRGQAEFEDGRFEPAYDEALEQSRPHVEIGRFSSGRFGQEGLQELRFGKDHTWHLTPEQVAAGFDIVQFGDDKVVELGAKTAPEVRAAEEAKRRYPTHLTQIEPDHYAPGSSRVSRGLQALAGHNGTSS